MCEKAPQFNHFALKLLFIALILIQMAFLPVFYLIDHRRIIRFLISRSLIVLQVLKTPKSRFWSNKNSKRSKTIKMPGNPYNLVTGLNVPPSDSVRVPFSINTTSNTATLQITGECWDVVLHCYMFQNSWFQPVSAKHFSENILPYFSVELSF